MAAFTVKTPYHYYPDPTRGRPIFNGFIYVGVADQDPEVAPLAVSLIEQNGSEVPIAQPIRTGAGGIPEYNGSPANITVATNYSLRLRDKDGAEVFYIPNAESAGILSEERFIPLEGTNPSLPITGDLVFDEGGIGSWTISQGDFGLTNVFALNANGASSLMWVTTRNALDQAQIFTFTIDGLLEAPGTVLAGSTGSTLITKDYFEQQVEPGTAVGDTLRWNGTVWENTTALQVDANNHVKAPSGAIFGSPATVPNATSQGVFEGTVALENPPTSSGTPLVNNFGVVSLQSSDERLKTNVRPSTKGIDILMQIETKQFGRDPEKYEVSEDTGFSAQQLQGPLPEAAPFNEATGMYGYRDTPIVSVLVKSMQEQQAMIEALTARLGQAGL